MRIFTSLVVLAVAGVVLSGCSLPGTTPKPASTTTKTAPAANEKSGDTTKTGVITETGGKFFIKVAGAPVPVSIDSYAVDLATYVGKTVTITGQYSGDTLFVGSITE